MLLLAAISAAFATVTVCPVFTVISAPATPAGLQLQSVDPSNDQLPFTFQVALPSVI